MSIPFRQPATSSGVNAKLMSRTQDTSTKGRVDFENTENSSSDTTGAVRVAGGIGIAKDLYVKGKSILNGFVEIWKGLVFGVEINTVLTGADAILGDYEKSVIVLKNAGLLSLAGIGNGADGKLLFIVNRTGNILVLKNNAEIDTGTGGNVGVKSGGMLILMRIGDDSRWRMVSGGGGGVPEGGLAGQVLIKNSATDGDVGWVHPDVSHHFGTKLDLEDNGQIPIHPTAKLQTWRIRGSSTPVRVNIQPFSQPGIDGMEITLVCDHSNFGVTIPGGDGGAQEIAGVDCFLNSFAQSVTYRYATDIGWFKKCASN
nr:hypothetical protein CKG001_10220 [Bdellovibrio sp. CKG001]